MSYVTNLIARAREIMEFSEDAQLIGELARDLEKAQPRIITTAEELAGLVDDTVIRDYDTCICERVGGYWNVPADGTAYGDSEISLPATVLYELKEETK